MHQNTLIKNRLVWWLSIFVHDTFIFYGLFFSIFFYLIALFAIALNKCSVCLYSFFYLLFPHSVTFSFSCSCYLLNALKHSYIWGANEALQVYILCACITINAADVILSHINSLGARLYCTSVYSVMESEINFIFYVHLT